MKKIPLIIDADTGIDDTLTLFLAAGSPKLDILAVTACFGNAYTKDTIKNTLNALWICNRGDIPVAGGAHKPWKKPIRTSPYIHGPSGIGDYVYKENNRSALSPKFAWDLSYEKIMESEDKVTILALGTLTNIGVLLRKYPQIKDRIERIVFMGGEVRESTAGSQCASVNIFHDPEAAHFVINSGVPFHMCSSSQVTNHVQVTKKTIIDSFSQGDEVSQAALSMLNFYYDACNAFGENIEERLTLHDPSTLMYLLEPDCFTSKKYHCDVDIRGVHTYGYTLIDVDNILNLSEEEKNIDFVSIDRTKADYIADKIIKGIRKARGNENK